jgi:tetratricopeptide (TPR) repeat protein
VKNIKSKLFLLLIISFSLVSCKKISNYYFTSGQDLYSKGKYQQALLKYNKAIVFDNNKKNHEYRGSAYLALEKDELALEDFNIALSSNTCFDPESFMRRGICYENQKDYKAAIMNYHEAIERNCGHRDYVYFLLGGTQKKVSDYVGAIRSFSEAIKLNNRVFEYYLIKGSAEYEYEDYNSALSTISSSLLADNPDKAKVFLFMGNCNFRLEQYSKAIYSYTLSIVDNQSDKEAQGVAYLNRGLCYISKFSFEEACSDFSKALECGDNKAQEMINKYCSQKPTYSKYKSESDQFECTNCNEITFRNPEFLYSLNGKKVLEAISVVNRTSKKLMFVKINYKCFDSSGGETDSGDFMIEGNMHPLVGANSSKRKELGFEFPSNGKIIFEIVSYTEWPCPTDEPC